MSEERLPFYRYCFPRSLWPLWDRRTIWSMLALLALVGGLYLWQAGEIAVAVHRIQELQADIERWDRKNAETEREITELTRVGELTSRARVLGFTGPSGDMYLSMGARSDSGQTSGAPSE
jgi:hypothetical protein